MCLTPERKEAMPKAKVPTEPVAAVVRKRLAGLNDYARTDLADELHISYRRLSDILNAVCGEIDFDIADELLCTLDIEYLWHSDPQLSAIYDKVDMSLTEPPKACPEGICANNHQRTEETMGLTARGHWYCKVCSQDRRRVSREPVAA